MKTYKVTILVLAIAIVLFIALPNLSWGGGRRRGVVQGELRHVPRADAAGKPAMKAPAVKGKTAADVTKAMENPKHAAVQKKVNEAQIKAIGDYLATLK